MKLSSSLHPSLLFERACLLDRQGRGTQAREAYLAVLADDDTHAGALANLGALLLAGSYTSAALSCFSQAARVHPHNAVAHVALGHALRQAGRAAAARASYQAALAIDAACHGAHQGLSYLLDGVDAAAAGRHRALGFAGHALSIAPYRGRRAPIRVLRVVSARGGNIDARRILDDRVCLTQTAIVEYAGHLPPCDVVFNAIGDADRCHAALETACRLLLDQLAPVINAPQLVLATGRLALARRLADLPDVRVPLVTCLARDDAAAWAALRPPLLLRSPGYHTGQHFLYVGAQDDVLAARARLPGETLLAIEFIDNAGADGAYRKYRAMLIGGRLLPLHLAISPHWKVHYYSAGMAERPHHQAEESRFLADMAGAIGPMAMRGLARIQSALGLDYAGVDFALGPDGRLILFEANATMVIAPPPDHAPADRRRAARRALAAARGLVRPTGRQAPS